MTLIAIALALLAEAGTPYPIPPQPLRWLYRDADLVVVAKAGETATVENAKDLWASAKVMLTVDKILKGQCGKEISVFHNPHMVCPAPDRYPAGSTVLAFLTWDKERGGYRTRGLSYGVKALNPADLDVYRRRLEELSKIPVEKPGEPASAGTMDWLVRCIEQPATRWEGAYEFTRHGGEIESLPLARLSENQRRRVIAAFIASRTMTWDDFLLAEVLKEVRDDRITSFLANQLRFVHARSELGMADSLMAAINDRLNLPGGSDLIERLKKSEDDKLSLHLVGKFLDLVEQQ